MVIISANLFRDVQVTAWANGTLEPFAPPYPSSPLEKWQTSTQGPVINPRDPLPATPANAITVLQFCSKLDNSAWSKHYCW